MKPVRVFATLAALAVIVAACSESGGIDVEGAWARTSPGVVGAGAVYMDITASETDRLIGASVSQDIAAMAEIHETTMNDDGTMMMQEVGRIDLAASETVSLQPGGLHIMLMQLTEPLETGETFDITLQFAESQDRVVEVEVREEAP